MKYLSIFNISAHLRIRFFFSMDSFLISNRYIFPKVEKLSSAQYVSELCCKYSFLYSCCNKFCNKKKQNRDLDFVPFSESIFSRNEFFSAIGDGFPTLLCVLLLLGHLLLCRYIFSSSENFIFVHKVSYDNKLSEVTGPWYGEILALVQDDRYDILLAHLFHLLFIWTPRSFLTYIWHASVRLNMTELFTLSVQGAIFPDNEIRQCNLLKFELIPSVRRLR